ncbi:MAG: SOS response-associated peptidase [Comamonadaceae bacterium]|nr:MAG: SOS response-associated peptidase [Comamonadaceae bacterium]
MCSHYKVPESLLFAKFWNLRLPEGTRDDRDLWPGYQGAFIRRPPERDSGDEAVPAVEALSGTFGLLPWWSKDASLAKRTYNARSETVAEKPSFRDAWKRAQHCIIPAASFYEPDWRSGKAVPTRFTAPDGGPIGIAGLWERWKTPAGIVHSYTMLTVNADDHPLLRDYHKPQDEKRMVVVLPPAQYEAWLDAPVNESMEFMRQYPHDQLIATPEPAEPKPKPPRAKPVQGHLL